MGNGQIGYDVSPYSALTDLEDYINGKSKLDKQQVLWIVQGLERYLKHLEENQRIPDRTYAKVETGELP